MYECIKVENQIKSNKIWNIYVRFKNISSLFSLAFFVTLYYLNYEKLYLFITEFIIIYQDFLFS